MALTDNLVAYWKFEGNSNDSVGSNNGTDTNVSYNSSYGKIGQGVSFNGAARITAGTSTGVANTTSGFSLNMWFSTTDYTKASFLVCKFESINENFSISYNDTGSRILTFRFYYGSSQLVYCNYTVTLTNNTYYHLVATYDGTTMKLYLNNSLVGTTTTSQTPVATGGLLNFGNREGGNVPFYGYLDEIGIWSRALSVGEVSALYNGGAGLTYPFTTFNPHFSRRKLL